MITTKIMIDYNFNYHIFKNIWSQKQPFDATMCVKGQITGKDKYNISNICKKFRVKYWQIFHIAMQRINLQHLRKVQGVTQIQLAELTGYPQGFISQIENGKAPAPAAFVEKLQEVFKMSEAEIYSLRPAGEKEPPEDTGTSSAELAEIVRRFINMVERRDEKIAQLEAEIERLKAQLSATSSNWSCNKLKTNALQKSITKICGFHVFCLWHQQNYQCFSLVSNDKPLKAAMLFDTNIRPGFNDIDKF